jgi:hypothetical protein
MGHLIALGVELCRSVERVFQDAEKLWCDLFPARHRRFDRRSLKLSGMPFESV